LRQKTIILSALIHVAVFALALRISTGRAARRATAVAVVNAEKKKAEPPKKAAPPRPLVASARPQAARPEPARAAAPTHVEEAPSAPLDTGLELSNDGPGIALPSASASASTSASATPTPTSAKHPVKKDKVLAPKATPDEDDCSEAPTKPVPVQRPSEIEYTQEARAGGIEGRLVLRITVGADGAVTAVEVVTGVDPQLDAAAVAAVKTWVFKPAARCGRPMAGGTFTLARRFELGD
jgi:protein TonB